MKRPKKKPESTKEVGKQPPSPKRSNEDAEILNKKGPMR